MNRPPYCRSDETAAHTYQADIYCPACLIEAMTPTASPPPPPATFLPTTFSSNAPAPSPSTETASRPTTPASSPSPFLDWLAPDATCARCHQSL